MPATLDRSSALRESIQSTGYYPEVVTDSVFASVAGEPVEAFLVHHEPTIDDRDEVRRHVTVLVLTPTRLILGHTDENPPDDLLPAPYTSSTCEAVLLSAVRNVVVSRIVGNPETYVAGNGLRVNEAVLNVGWGAVGRLDLEPAVCGDPHCDADHGYTGVMAGDDFSLRVSSAAEGPEAVADLLEFADVLSARSATTR